MVRDGFLMVLHLPGFSQAEEGLEDALDELEASYEAQQALRSAGRRAGRAALAQQLRASAGLEKGSDQRLQSALAVMESSVGRRYLEHLPERACGWRGGVESLGPSGSSEIYGKAGGEAGA